MKEWFIAIMLFTLPVIGCAKAIDPGPLPATAGHASALTVGEAGSLQTNGGSAGNVESDDVVIPSAGAPGVTVTVIIDDGEDGGAETVPPATGGLGSSDPNVNVNVDVNIDNTNNNTGVGGGTSNPDNDEDGGAPVDSSTGGSETGYGGATTAGGWEDPGTDPNNGGSVESGGSAPTGGVSATGGQEPTGGTVPVSTGGVSTGGTETGGISTGGTTATGGTDGTTALGPPLGTGPPAAQDRHHAATPTSWGRALNRLPTNNRLVNGSGAEIYLRDLGAPRRFIQIVVKSTRTNVQLANYRFSRNGQFFSEDEVVIAGSDGVDLAGATVASDGIAIVSLSASEPTDGTTRYCVSAVPNSGPGGIVNTRMSDAPVTSVSGTLDSVDGVWSVDGEVGPVLWTDDVQLEEEWWNYGITMPLGSTTIMY